MTMEMAVCTRPVRRGGPAGGDLAGRQLRSLMRTALAWAVGGAMLAGLVWAAIGPHHLGDLLGSACGSVLALVFLSTGRSIQLLSRGGSAASALVLFITQLAVLGVLGGAVLDGGLLHRLGTGPVPAATSVAGVALAWTIGVVVAGRRPHQRIYDDREGR